MANTLERASTPTPPGEHQACAGANTSEGMRRASRGCHQDLRAKTGSPNSSWRGHKREEAGKPLCGQRVRWHAHCVWSIVRCAVSSKRNRIERRKRTEQRRDPHHLLAGIGVGDPAPLVHLESDGGQCLCSTKWRMHRVCAYSVGACSMRGWRIHWRRGGGADEEWVNTAAPRGPRGEEERAERERGEERNPSTVLANADATAKRAMDAKRITNATKRAKSAIASERAKPKMAYPKSCFESVGLRDTE